MKKYFIVGLFAVLSLDVLANEAKKVCEELQPAVADLQKQAPLAVDYMTKLTGAQAIYAVNRCLLNYNYIVDSEHFLKEMMEGNELTKAENLSFLQTEDGIKSVESVFGDIAKKAANAHFKPFLSIKGITITYSYSFDNTKIPSVVATVLDNKP